MRPSRTGSFVAVLFLLTPSALYGQSQSPDGVWTRLTAPPVHTFDFEPAQGSGAPSSTFGLSQERIGTILRSAPREFTEQAKNNPTIVSIPFPDGKFERFRVELAPVIEKPLESKGFETLTYKGIGIDDPTATIRFEQAFDGFHAMVRSSRGVFYIDPARKPQRNEAAYVSYFASSRPGPIRKVHCAVSSDQAKRARRSGQNRPLGRPGPGGVAFAPVGLRTYRLAIAVNSYYVSAVYDASQAASPFDQAAKAVQATVNRINGIYESELGIHLTLVPNEGKLIYIDPGGDPYRSVNGSAQAQAALHLNQKNLDRVIGSVNYDIGHLFTTGTAGLAMLHSVCDASIKAQGVTGIETPKGDDFDVDYVSHEIGHQFGANHTFNAITKYCNGNRNDLTAYEPGSGSTIMGYAGNGICDPESLQDHSDAYFHLASLLEIADFISDTSPGAGGSCGASVPLSFAPPSVSASGTYTVPRATAFVLTAEIPDTPPNPTLFNWEEFDLGDPAPPDDESGPPSAPRPLFRSKRPDARTYRFFPDFEKLIDTSGTPVLGETFPLLNRTMKFRVIGRNNHGSFTYVEVPVKIDVNSGPFKITAVSGGNSWARGSTHMIRWDTASTNSAPINCSVVDLFIAVDGSPANLYALARGISNSGSYNLTIPADAPLTDQAFLILKANKNIFVSVYPYSLQIPAP